MKLQQITIVGAGSTGSFTSFMLAKMNSHLSTAIRVIDFDTIEPHNAMNQLYLPSDAGRLKTQRLQEIVLSTTGVAITTNTTTASDTTHFFGIVIVLVDSQSARRAIFDACAYRAHIPYFIDGRTGEHNAIIYAFDPRDRDAVLRYEKILNHAHPEPAPCATPESIPTLFMLAAGIGHILSEYQKSKIHQDGFKQIKITGRPILKAQEETLYR